MMYCADVMFCSTEGNRLNWKKSKLLPFGEAIDSGTAFSWKIWITKFVRGDLAVKLRAVMSERPSRLTTSKLKFVIGMPE